MDLNDIKEKYPNLKKYLRFLSPDNILKRTFAIEKTGNEEILDEWIEYWSEINRINATKIIVNLKSISEEKRNNYKEMLIKKITTSYSNNSNYKKLYYLIMVNLYFNDEKEIENILKYLRWVIGIESEDTDEAEKISPIETVEYILRKRDIRKVKSKEKLIKFCQGIQKGSPIDSQVIPESSPMGGYEDEVIMAAGTFTEGSTIELSCDGPVREPYIAYMQGGLTYDYGKYGILKAIEEMNK